LGGEARGEEKLEEAMAMEMGAGVGRRRSGRKLVGRPPHEIYIGRPFRR
jgi:hypothetical protein